MENIIVSDITSEDIIIHIDGRVLIQGSERFKAPMQHYPHARRESGSRAEIVGKTFIHMAAIVRDPDIDPDLAKPCFIEHFIKYACANEVAVGESQPLTKGGGVVMALYIKKSMTDRQ